MSFVVNLFSHSFSIEEEEARERDDENKDKAGTRHMFTTPRHFCHLDSHLDSISQPPLQSYGTM